MKKQLKRIVSGLVALGMVWGAVSLGVPEAISADEHEWRFAATDDFPPTPVYEQFLGRRGTIEEIDGGFRIWNERGGKLATGELAIASRFVTLPSDSDFRIFANVRITGQDTTASANQRMAGLIVFDTLQGRNWVPGMTWTAPGEDFQRTGQWMAFTQGPAFVAAGLNPNEAWNRTATLVHRSHNEAGLNRRPPSAQGVPLPVEEGRTAPDFNNNYHPIPDEVYVELIRIGNTYISIVNGMAQTINVNIDWGREIYVGLFTARGIEAEFTNIGFEAFDSETAPSGELDFSGFEGQMEGFRLIGGIPEFPMRLPGPMGVEPDWSLLRVIVDGEVVPIDRFGIEAPTNAASVAGIPHEGVVYAAGAIITFPYIVIAPPPVTGPADVTTPTPAPVATPTPAPTPAPPPPAEGGLNIGIIIAVVAVAAVVIIGVVVMVAKKGKGDPNNRPNNEE